MEFGNYINLRMEGEYSRLTVGPTRDQLARGVKVDVEVPDISSVGKNDDDTEEISDSETNS
jgi:hypothetical protein